MGVARPRRLWLGIVGSKDFEGARVARCSGDLSVMVPCNCSTRLGKAIQAVRAPLEEQLLKEAEFLRTPAYRSEQSVERTAHVRRLYCKMGNASCRSGRDVSGEPLRYVWCFDRYVVMFEVEMELLVAPMICRCDRWARAVALDLQLNMHFRLECA
jgi:hypothetical protein